MLSTTCTIRVRYAETDAMAVTYHGAYFPFLEQARIQLLDDLGYPYRDLEKQGFLLPVLEAHVKWLRPSRFDDRIDVTAEIRDSPSVRLEIHYTIKRDDTLLLTGYTRHAFVSPEGRPIKPPSELIAAMQAKMAGK